MAFGLYSLLEAALLVLNAMCVLHEERFLAKVRAGPDYFRCCSGTMEAIIPAAVRWSRDAAAALQDTPLHYTHHSYTVTHTLTHIPKQELDIQLRNRRIKLFCGFNIFLIISGGLVSKFQSRFRRGSWCQKADS